MIDLDWNRISEHLILLCAGGGISWIFSRLLAVQKDLNAAFFKIRNLEKEVYGEQKDDNKGK